MAMFFLLVGLHFLFTAPSHYAADAIAESINKFNEQSTPDARVYYIRIYRRVSEQYAFVNSSVDKHDAPHHSGDESDEEEDLSTEPEADHENTGFSFIHLPVKVWRKA
ncbi:hypothetical protein FQN53_000682 [Emmonsiellopsis sp. PD_33]|nr:hypothetical protein FQN53_000682 [Emmonsiellopsis sp. PD_33]